LCEKANKSKKTDELMWRQTAISGAISWKKASAATFFRTTHNGSWTKPLRGIELWKTSVRLELGQIQFRWKDYRDDNRHKTMTLGADEFIRRFLLHVLPDGFQRIRYFGFLANRYRAEKLALCRQLMQMPPPATTREVNKDYRDQYEALTGISLKKCPLCRCGNMVVIETFECTSSRASLLDTS
jgi:hypothetical protein